MGWGVERREKMIMNDGVVRQKVTMMRRMAMALEEGVGVWCPLLGFCLLKA